MTENQKANMFLTASAQSNKAKTEDTSATEIVELGSFKPTEMLGYAYKLTSLHKIPADSCLAEMTITKCENHQITLSKAPTDGEPEESCYSELNLRIVPQMTRQNCLATNPKQCVQFIAGGKCRDKFVVEHIGKKFFPDIYSKQH